MHKKETKPDKKLLKLIPIALIIILGWFVYANSLKGGFIWDDDFLVKDNAYIKSWSHILKIFTEDIGAGARSHYIFYRPLQMITYMLDYSFWKLNVVGYHSTNILLHILVALSIFRFIDIIFKDRIISFLAGVFFIAHPMHTEVVSYISGRTDSLAFLFLLVCFILYIKQLRLDSLSRYIFMLLSYILALLSREASLILPALLLVYHYVFNQKIKTKEFLSILGLTFLYALLRFTLLRGLLAGVTPADTTVFQRLPGVFAAITNYITLLISPFNLHMEYGYRQFNLAEPKVIIGIGIFVISLIYAFKQRRANKLISFSILWFFIGLSPVSDIYPVNAYMAEHWLYLPSLGFFLILAQAIVWLYKRKKIRIITIIFTCALLAFYSYLTVRQNNYWGKPITFYEMTLKFTPNSPRMLNNLGEAYDKIGRKEEAIMLYREAIKFDPRCAEAYNNIGTASVNMGKYIDAIVAYQQAIAINPNYAEIHNNLAKTYLIIGKREDAITVLKKAIEIDPSYAMSYYNLAAIYFNQQQYDLTIYYYDKAIELGLAAEPAVSKLIESVRQKK